MTTGNILQHGACADFTDENCTSTHLLGNFTNNVEGDVHKSLRDPDNLDFRPLKDSDYLAKGIGPYGKESMSSTSCSHDPSVGGVYRIPGHQQLLASMPIPPNKTTTAKCDADLMWLAGYGAQSHDVYFGTNKTAIIANADLMSPVMVCELKSPANIVSLSEELKPAVTYYWLVDSKAMVESNAKDKCGNFSVNNGHACIL